MDAIVEMLETWAGQSRHYLTEARRRIRLLAEAFRKDGTRITENLDFEPQRPKAQ